MNTGTRRVAIYHCSIKIISRGKDKSAGKGMKTEYAKLTAERKTLNQTVPCPQRRGNRSRANPQECLQYPAAGTAATATTQDAGSRIAGRQNGGQLDPPADVRIIPIRRIQSARQTKIV